MKYFLDTEFHEYKKREFTDTIELISIGIVAEDGRELYRVSKHFDWHAACNNEWLKLNVIKSIYEEVTGDLNNEGWHLANGAFRLWYPFADAITEKGFTPEQIREDVIAFVGDDPDVHFYGYCADYDWVVFCWLFGRMIDLPKGFPMYCRDLKQIYDERFDKDAKKAPDYPKQANKHNALDDAKWNRDLFNWMERQVQPQTATTEAKAPQGNVIPDISKESM